MSEYVEKERPIKDLAAEFGVGYRAMWQRIMRLGILVRKSNRRLNLNGKVFGKLTVISFEGVKGTSAYWKARCECGKIILAKASSFGRENRRSCGCDVGFARGSAHALWCGFGEISGSAWCKIQDAAHERGIAVNISIEQAWAKFLKQNRKCAITGVDLVFAKDSLSHTRGATTASLDRIDSSKGYTSRNVQWVHKVINRMKWDLPSDEFYRWCSLVTKYRPSLLAERVEG